MRFIPKTVRFRTTAVATVVLVLALVISAIVVVNAQRITLTNTAKDVTQTRVAEVAQSLSTGATPQDVSAQEGDDLVIQIVDATTNEVVSSSLRFSNEPIVSGLTPAVGVVQTRQVEHLEGRRGGGDWFVAAEGVSAGGATYIVYVANSLESATEGSVVLAVIFAIAVPILGLLAGLTTWTVVGRALRPVEEMRLKAESIDSTEGHERIPEPGTNDEIGHLAQTMNAMLDRLDISTQRQRRFVSDASHELRSPLTSIRTRLEVDLRYPEGADWQGSARDVLEEAERLSRLVDDLLLLARQDARTSAPARKREATDLDELVLAEVEILRRKSDHEIDTSEVSGAQLVGNLDELTQIIRNLLDNAERHANNKVSIHLSENDTEITLRVRDDGPGIPDGQQDRIFERFTRLDEARARDAGGSGLGLAIVKEIVSNYGGTISVTNQGGAIFTVRLPVAN